MDEIKVGDRVRFTRPDTKMPDTDSMGEVIKTDHSVGSLHCRVRFDDGNAWWTPVEFLEKLP